MIDLIVIPRAIRESSTPFHYSLLPITLKRGVEDVAPYRENGSEKRKRLILRSKIFHTFSLFSITYNLKAGRRPLHFKKFPGVLLARLTPPAELQHFKNKLLPLKTAVFDSGHGTYYAQSHVTGRKPDSPSGSALFKKTVRTAQGYLIRIIEVPSIPTHTRDAGYGRDGFPSGA